MDSKRIKARVTEARRAWIPLLCGLMLQCFFLEPVYADEADTTVGEQPEASPLGQSSPVAQSGPASESEPPPPDSEQANWIPILEVGFDLHLQTVTSNFHSSNVPTLDNTTRSYSSAGSEMVMTPMISLGASAMGPILSESLWQMRPFVSVRGQLPSQVEKLIKRDGETYKLDPKDEGEGPAVAPGDPPTPIFAGSYSGTQNIRFVGLWFAGVGLDFTIPSAFDRISLRPSLHYFGQRVGYVGDVALEEYPNPCCPAQPRPVPVFAASGKTYTTYQGLAPRLNLDASVGRARNFEFSMWAEYQALIILSENRTSQFGVYNQLGSGSGLFEFSVDRVAHQVGFGVRVRWLSD